MEEEPSAVPLSRRAARKAKKARICLAQSSLDSVVQAGSHPQPQELANTVPYFPSRSISVAIRPRQGSKTVGEATRESALMFNMSTAQDASTPSKITKKGAKSGRGAKTKDPAPPHLGSEDPDISVVARPSNIKPAVSLRPGADAKAIDVTAKALNQADTPRTCTRGRFYPPELESFYKRARRDRKWTRRVAQLKASLVNAKSAAEKEMIANDIFVLIDEAQTELCGDGASTAPHGLRWKADSTFEIQAPTLEDKVVGKALHALMESKPLRELGVGDHYNFYESAQQWWNRYRPSTAAQKDLESSTIEALSLYGHHVRRLLQHRAELNLRRRAHSAASSHLGRASTTLQCLVRQGTCCTKFWRSRQNSAQMGVRQATTALREARANEARVVSTVSPWNY